MSISRKSASTILFVFILLAGLSLVRCARPGSPTGGPKDETPPSVVLEIPPNRTINFNFTKATITFDEFISLKDLSKEIFIAPPMKTKPEFKVAGKKVIIEFQEELKVNATYTINFGNSIVDFTEGNPLVNYEYVFSTGSHIDSLSIPGKVLNAFDHKPEEGIIVMVYQDENDTIPLDSLPLRVPPKSASKTTKDGAFRINNLASGTYKLFALEDLNNNFIYDLPNERIAFLDSLISIEPVIIPDTMPAVETDTLLVDEADTIMAEAVDTAASENLSPEILTEKSYTLYLFTEANLHQKLLSKKLIGRNLLQYIFQRPADSVRLKLLGFQPGRPDWYITEFGILKDTVNFWLKPGLPDTIRVRVQAADSIADTSKFILSKSSVESKGKKKETVATSMAIASNTFAGAFDLNKKLTLGFGIPIEDYDPARIHLFTPTDTMIASFSFTDTVQRKGIVDHKFLPGQFCVLLIEDSVFCDLSGAYNDSTAVRFKVRQAEDYGILLMNIHVPEHPGQFIIQLLSEKDAVIRQKIIAGSDIVRFDYLMPGNFKIKIIFDDNSNGEWDTGNYGRQALPERVEYFSSTLNIRANWDLQEDWQLE
jgi:hypothetical protein